MLIEFLMDSLAGQRDGQRVHALEGDFGVFVTDGAQLAIDERIKRELTGRLPTGEVVTRTVGVCGPGAYIVLKALAFADRGEPKDAYDLLYVLRATAGAPQTIAERLVQHAEKHEGVVRRALTLLARDFDNVDAIGPQRAAEFEIVGGSTTDQVDAAIADAHGHVDDFLTACRNQGLLD